MYDSKNSQADGPRPPLALQVRRLRQWSHDRRLLQAELAFLSGMSLRLVRKYESARKLPRAIEALVAMSLILDVPIEQLIAPDRIATLKAAITERRAMLDEHPNSDRVAASPGV